MVRKGGESGRKGEKYHGAMPKMTPYGSLYTIALVPGLPVIGASPFRLEILPAISFKMSAARVMLKSDQNSPAPVSSVIYLDNSLFLLLNISAVLRKMSRFAAGGRSRHAGKAAWAAVTAERASATEAEEQW